MLIFFLPKPALLANTSFSRAVYDEHHHLMRLTLSHDDQYRLFVPLSEISKPLIAATLLQEDQYFYWHIGINPWAMLKASWQTYHIKSRRQGASTITMQVARMRFGIQSKTASGKLLQILRALQLEMHYNKNQILEAYFNLAPYGNNIEGIGAASLIYFAKPAKQIDLPEAITLSVIPQNPTQRTPQQKNLQNIRQKLFMRWVAQHSQDKDKNNFIKLPLQMRTVHELPFLAPHFVNTLLADTTNHQQEITSTLDLRLQKIIERVTHNYLARKKSVGADNAAILLVDTRDNSIKALMGSADFFNKQINGQINGTQINRSPGSTLKPFVYGLALDQGLIHPDTMLKDVPRSFGHYNPENFDYDFMGPIKAKDALVLSRNIPAIYLADQLSNPNLYQLLEQAHITHLKPESYYGLALTLGGAEISMQELTSLYAMLVNEGVWQPLHAINNEKSDHTHQRLLSPEASFLVLDMLKNTPRPDGYFANDSSLPVSWKTGTSSGYRDAWAVGSFGPYVLTVWLGNFNNVGNPTFVGKNIAAPLFFEIIDAMQHETGPIPSLAKNPDHLRLRKIPVCKLSGMLPTPYCHDTELTWFIPGKSPIKTDTIYREVAINSLTGLRTCHYDNHTQFAIYEFWPSDLLKIFKLAGIQRHSPPPYDNTCHANQTTRGGLEPQITSPKTQVSYIISKASMRPTMIPLTAITDADVKTVFWFINKTYLAKISRDQAFLWRGKPGKYIVRVVDDHGRSDAREVFIQNDR